jgi:oxygen-dependent protoporphyrinogen oxidase
LILAVPADEAARLLKEESHLLKEQSSQLSQALAQVSYSPLVSATIFAKKSQFPAVPQGLGVLMPKVEARNCLGILFNSSAFPHRVENLELVSFTMMLGGSQNPELLEKSDAELRSLIIGELRHVLAMEGEPVEIRIHRWPRAVPKYNAHLLQTWKLAQRTWCAQPGRVLFGNYTGQVSLRGMVEVAKRCPCSFGSDSASSAASAGVKV